MENGTCRVGVVGCGKISDIYLKNLSERFAATTVTACTDLQPERARAKAEQYGIRALDMDAFWSDSDIDLVLNLTIPVAHYEVGRAALEAGKHVYNEKPLTVTREDAQALLKLAGESGLLVGCAPDTFLGAGLQTCRKLIDDGAIGEPVACTGFMLSHGPESWHPDPEFYYKPGGGPLFDMGPYYLTAMIHLLGPVKRVSAAARTSFAQRTIGSEAKRGQTIDVEVLTHVSTNLEFAAGPIGTLVTSFDSWGAQLPRIEIYGTEGSLSVPDPNGFGGPVYVRRADSKEWEEAALTHGLAENARGVGAADMGCAALSGRPHRASGELAGHVTDIMVSAVESAEQGRFIELASTCAQPAPLPTGLADGELDA